MKIEITMIGTQPLICHNARLSDPLDDIKKELARYTSKRKKTEADHERMSYWEFMGGLYVDDGIEGPVMPTANLKKCLIEGAKLTKQGRQTNRALMFDDMSVPLVYEGTRDIEELYEDKSFVDRRSVGQGQSRIMRTRPKFPDWAVTATAYLIPELMDLEQFQDIADTAGRIEGLGDNRTNGYGRFDVTVTKA